MWAAPLAIGSAILGGLFGGSKPANDGAVMEQVRLMEEQRKESLRIQGEMQQQLTAAMNRMANLDAALADAAAQRQRLEAEQAAAQQRFEERLRNMHGEVSQELLQKQREELLQQTAVIEQRRAEVQGRLGELQRRYPTHVIPAGEIQIVGDRPFASSGATCQVWRCTVRNGVPAALKLLSAVYAEDDQESAAAFQAEFEATFAAQGHENITQLVGFCPSFPLAGERRMGFVLEFVEGLDVRKWLDDPTANVTYAQALGVARQVAAAIKFIHGKNLLFLDLKSPNVLLCATQDFVNGGVPTVKVTDFGCSQKLGDDYIRRGVEVPNYMQQAATRTLTQSTQLRRRGAQTRTIGGRDYLLTATVHGTIYWLAPEILLADEPEMRYTRAVDVWAFGMLMYELVTLLLPWGAYSNTLPENQLRRLLQGQRRPIIDGKVKVANVPPQYLQLMRDCWEQDPARRPSFDTICTRLGQC